MPEPDPSPAWLKTGHGRAPRLCWQFAAEAPLAGLDVASETGAAFLADESGGLYRIERSGQLGSVSRGFHDLRRLAWSEAGATGVLLSGDSDVVAVTDRFQSVWTLSVPEPVLDVAIEPHGRYIAVAMANGATLLYDANRRRVASWESARPLRFLRFLQTEATVLGAAEYGLLGAWQVDGTVQWQEKLWSNAGALAASGDGQRIYLAAYSYGLQSYGSGGTSLGSFVIEGNPNLVSVSHDGSRVAVTTLERRLLLLTGGGDLVWHAELPGDPAVLLCEATGDALLCGLTSGHVLRLSWA